MRKSAPRNFLPFRADKKSDRFFKRSGIVVREVSAGTVISKMGYLEQPMVPVKLSRESLAAACTASGDDLAAADGRDARTEAVAPLANKLGWLIGTLHLFQCRGVRPFLGLQAGRPDCRSVGFLNATGHTRKSGSLNVRGL